MSMWFLWQKRCWRSSLMWWLKVRVWEAYYRKDGLCKWATERILSALYFIYVQSGSIWSPLSNEENTSQSPKTKRNEVTYEWVFMFHSLDQTHVKGNRVVDNITLIPPKPGLIDMQGCWVWEAFWVWWEKSCTIFQVYFLSFYGWFVNNFSPRKYLNCIIFCFDL